MKKGKSVSKLKIAIAALNFKFNEVEHRFKIKKPKYRDPDNVKHPHSAYTKEEVKILFA